MMFFKKNKVSYEILKKINKRDRIKRYSFLIIGCFLLAVSFNLFFSPNNIVTGGISGLAIVIENICGFKSIWFINISYILLLIISYFMLGKKDTKYSTVGSILYPLFVFLTQDIASYIYFDVNNLL